MMSSNLYAHSGRTDSSGGHHNYSDGTGRWHSHGGGGEESLLGIISLAFPLSAFPLCGLVVKFSEPEFFYEEEMPKIKTINTISIICIFISIFISVLLFVLLYLENH